MAGYSNTIFKKTGDMWECVEFRSLCLGDEFRIIDSSKEPDFFHSLGIWRVRVEPSLLGKGINGEPIFTLDADPVDDIAKAENITMERKCRKCKEVLPLRQFPTDKRCKENRSYLCKRCHDG